MILSCELLIVLPFFLLQNIGTLIRVTSRVVFVPYCFDNLILFYHSVHEHNFLFSLRRNWKDSYWHIVVSSH